MSHKVKTIMFQGTGSGVGKSIVAAALCRILSRQGCSVAPFKAQNMALNSFVTADGKEMGRAQVFQAEACGIAPEARMNPILLKPTGDSRSQVIVMGEPVDHYSARDYYTHHEKHLSIVGAAFDSLAEDFDIIVMEGAGSPAEINLQATDIVNMAMAEYAGAPVIIIGDIDRGGVFAWLKGTWDLVREPHRHFIKGFLINKFRGDVSLLEPGIRQFSDIVPVPVLGTMPWFNGIEVDQEDGCFVHSAGAEVAPREALHICVIHLPRISNFTDFSPLGFEPDVELRFSSNPAEAGRPACIILPGTKATRQDLQWLKQSGWIDFIRKQHENGVMVCGICGGYQMLGMEVRDPKGIEGPAGTTPGLGLLPIVTTMEGKKQLCQTKANIFLPPMISESIDVQGYEIHMGQTTATGPFTQLGPDMDQSAAAASSDLQAWGTYLHGIFANDGFRRGFLDYLRKKQGLTPINRSQSWHVHREEQLDGLADWMETNVDMARLRSIMGI